MEIDTLMKSWGIPDRFKIGEPNSAQQAIHISPAGGYLFGTIGAGKSWLAAYWLRKMKIQGWIEVPPSGSEIDPKYRLDPHAMPKWIGQSDLVAFSGQDDFGDHLRYLQRVAALVVDDFDPENMTAHRGEILYALVNERYSAGLPTLITSNCGTSEVVKAGRRWSALVDRMAEAGLYLLNGKSLRTGEK